MWAIILGLMVFVVGFGWGIAFTETKLYNRLWIRVVYGKDEK